MPPVSGAGGRRDVSTFVAKARWNLERFGMSPRKIPRRLLNRSEPRIVLNSLPKAGTHLVERALALHPRCYRKLMPVVTAATLPKSGGFDRLLRGIRPGQFMATHLEFDPRYPGLACETGVRTVFQIRDPRDLVVSHAHYVSATPRHYLYEVYRRYPDFRDRLRLSIVGHPDSGFPSIGERLRDFAGWLERADVVVRFESLVGSAGGGNDELQLDTIRALYRSLGIGVDDSTAAGVAARLFSRVSSTFRRGLIGQWRQHFDEGTGALFASAVGDGLEVYGYAHP